jgi:hypothetical protein
MHNKNDPSLYNLLSTGEVTYHRVLSIRMTQNEEPIHAWSILRHYTCTHEEEPQQWYPVPSENSNLVTHKSVEHIG